MLETDENLFVRVVEAGSLKAAAESVHADPSTVSRRIAALEERLGLQLLKRSTRGSRPTDAGARYYAGLRRLMDEFLALEAEVTGTLDEPRGLLRVTAPSSFGARFVVPVLNEMCDAAPELEVEVILGSRFFDMTERGIDVAVRIGALRDSSLRMQSLGGVPRVLVASPDYLARRGRPAQPADLADHEFIFYARGNVGASITMTTRSGAEVSIPMSGRFTVNSIPAIVELVEAGRGLHFGPLWAFAEQLEAGRLQRVLPDWNLPEYPAQAVYPPSAYVPAKVRQFIARMKEHVAASPGLTPSGAR